VKKEYITKTISVIIACGLGSITHADSYSHTALTTFCPHQGTVVGTCTSSHSGGFADAINLKCIVKQSGSKIGSNKFSESDLEGSTVFNFSASGPLIANRNYCTHNKSRYLVQGIFGLIEILNQGDSFRHCEFYRVSGTGR
jgi:hypothetical protein